MSTRALQFDILLLGFRDPDTDAPLAFGVVNFLSAGTSDPLTVWDTKEKTGAKTSVTLDVNGQAQVYGDGVYKLEILDSDSVAVSYSPRDNIKIRAVSTNVVETNTTYTATTDDDLILCDTSGGAVLINLYPAADFITGLTIKNISLSGNDVTVDPDGAELIDGAATQALVDGQANEFFSNGSGWFGNGVSTGTNFTSTSLVFGDGLSESTFGGVTTVATTLPHASIDFNIGDWDMSAATGSSTTTVTATGVNGSLIRGFSVTIWNDAATSGYDLGKGIDVTDSTPQGFVSNWQLATANPVITLNRLTGGQFDSTDFDATSFNRGYLTVWYTV